MITKRAIATISALALLLGACSSGTSGQSSSTSTPGGTVSSTQTGTILERSKGVTFRKVATSTPGSWNIHNEVTLDARIMNGNLTDGFYNIKGNEAGDGYEFVAGMASEFPVDITSQYAGDSTYNVPADAKEGYAFSIKLNKDAKWEDGTPITADDYIYSYKQLLDPMMKNRRADQVYTGRMIVANAEKYFKQGDSYEHIVTADGVANVSDNDMYFSMIQPVKFFSAAASDYYNNPSYNDKFTVNGTNIYNKYKNQVYWKLTPEAKKDLNAIAAAFGDKNPDAYKEFSFKKVVNDPVDFDKVGIKKAGEHELHLILDKSISEFFLKYTLTSNYLVHKDTYESNKNDFGGLVQTKYMTSLDTTKSYGPYKMTEFIDKKLVVYEQNPNWYGWTNGDYEWKGNYDKIRVDIIPEYETQFQTFLQGKIDTVVLNPEKSDYYASDYLVQVADPTTWSINFYTDKAGLKRQESPGINKTLLAYEDFRKGISIGIDRTNIAKVLDPLAPPTSVLIGPLYVADPDTGKSYRSSEYAKQALIDVYGGTDADASYNPELARELITKAYNEAVANGDYKDGDIIEIKYPRATDNDRGKKILKAIEDGILEVLKGTPLEGKFKVSVLITDAWHDKMVSGEGQVTISGVTGGVMDPYSYFEYLTRPSNTFGFNFDKVDLEIEVNGKKEKNSIYGWVTELDSGKYSQVDDDIKMYILSRIEAATIDTFAFIPIQEDASNSLYSKRTSTQYDSYIPLVSLGETYFSMTDAEWDSYVSSQNGQIDYK